MSGVIITHRTNTTLTTMQSSLPDSAFMWMAYDEAHTSIDLRAEFAEIMENHGHWVFLRRRLSVRAHTYDDTVNEAYPRNDPYSWKGHLYQDEPYLTRSRPTTSEARGAVDQFLTAFGDLTVRHLIFYFAHDVRPSVLDGVVYCTLGDDGNFQRPYNIERFYDIQATYPFRDKKGRVEYWAVLAEQRSLGK